VTLTDDLDIATWPRHFKDVPASPKTNCIGQGFQKLEHYRQTDGQTDKQTDRQTDSQPDSQTDRQRFFALVTLILTPWPRYMNLT